MPTNGATQRLQDEEIETVKQVFAKARHIDPYAYDFVAAIQDVCSLGYRDAENKRKSWLRRKYIVAEHAHGHNYRMSLNPALKS